jgi:hypothetical protein
MVPYLPLRAQTTTTPGQTNLPQQNLITNIELKDAGKTLKVHWRKGGGQGTNFSAKLPGNIPRKGSDDREQVGDKLIPEAGKEVDHRAHLLSQRAASKTELPHKTEKKKTANFY